MARLVVRVIIAIFLCFATIMIWQVSRFYMFLKRTSYTITPYSHQNLSATMKVLFLGDSTAVGTGANTNTESVAGWLAKDFPQAHIDNFSRNGRKLKEQLFEYDFKSTVHYNLVIIQIGGNDILRFTPLVYIRRDLSELIDRAKSMGDHVVVLHSGNVGIAPLFIWPISDFLTQRTKAVRAIYQEIAHAKGAMYIDLYHERVDDPLNKNIDRYYSLDYLHPSGFGYQSWYARIRSALKEAGVL